MTTSLLNCLSELSMEENRRIALRCGLSPRTNSKQTLMREVYERLTDPHYLHQLLEELEEDERLAVEHLVRRSHRHPESLDTAPRLIYGLLGTRTGRADRVLATLAEKGLLFPGGEGEDHASVFPAELAEGLLPLVGAVSEPWRHPRKAEPARVFPASHHLAHDLVGFLAYARKNSIRMTQNAEIFRRVLEHLQAQRIVRRGPLPLDDAAEKEEQQSGVGMLLAFAVHAEYLQAGERRVEARESALARLRACRLLELGRDLLFFLERMYLANVSLYQRLFALLREAEAERWYDLEPLLDHLLAGSRKSSPDTRHQRSGLLWLIGTLHDLSLLDLGCDAATRDWALRLTAAGRAMLSGEMPRAGERSRCEVHVLPDFTVLAPFQIEADERWQLESFADLVSADTIFTYRITRQSIYRALQEGIEVDSILAFFLQHGERQLPQNVEYSVREWAASFGRIHFADVLLLRCENEELAAEVAASPDIRRYIEGQITPRDLLVSRAGYEEIVKYLEKMGHLPRTLRK